MNNIHKALASLAVAVPLIAVASGGAVKSGLSTGEMVSAFEPTHVTGPDAGTNTCPVCKYGNTPAAQVWVNGDQMGNVEKIATTMESAIKTEGPDKLKGFIVFIKPTSESSKTMEAQLKGIAAKLHLHNVGLLYVPGANAEPIGEYKINTSSSVKNTVLVYRDRKVSANFVNLKADNQGTSSLKAAMLKAGGM